jgi:putative ABC transport system permease protein
MAFRNLRRNFNNYLIYFVSMVFSIMIYHVFTSIQYNEQVANLTEIKSSIFVTFKASSIIIAIFACIFIWYSNSFFTKRRKKEVALYSLMGVRKGQIGRMLFYENILMGLLALAAGILLGSLLTKLFVMLLLELMGFNINVAFAIHLKPIISTAEVFALLFLITSIHGYSIIYRFKLIDLFKAENVGSREPKASLLAAMLSILLIGGGYAYYLGSRKVNMILPFATLALVVSGTYLLFSSLTVYIIKLAKKDKGRYYKGINLISTSQLMYRLKVHARTLATIAVLSATTLTAMGVTSSFYYDFQTGLSDRQPFSYVLLSEKKGLDKKADAIIAKYPQNSIEQSVPLEITRISGKLPDIGFYTDSKIRDINVIPASEFNRIAEARGLKDRIYLDYYNDIVFLDAQYSAAYMEPYTGKKLQLINGGTTQSYNIKDFKSIPLLNEFTADYVAVVNDDVYLQLKSQGKTLYGMAYKVNNQNNSGVLTEELYNIMKADGMDMKNIPRYYAAYYDRYKAEVAGSGLTIFIGAFLGLVFLMATGSIIFFKQLSEANEDKKRYQILRNVGYGRKDIKAIIGKQMLLVFILPLFVGVMHSIVAVYLLKKLMGFNIFIPLLVTIGAYTLIYMIYYFLTVNAYNRLVDSRG